ncbi:unnamed protein product [Camellia sinensis]
MEEAKAEVLHLTEEANLLAEEATLHLEEAEAELHLEGVFQLENTHIFQEEALQCLLSVTQVART